MKRSSWRSVSECMSCESGWTMYLDDHDHNSSSSSNNKYFPFKQTTHDVEDDLSMVSDASSGPPPPPPPPDETETETETETKTKSKRKKELDVEAAGGRGGTAKQQHYYCQFDNEDDHSTTATSPIHNRRGHLQENIKPGFSEKHYDFDTLPLHFASHHVQPQNRRS